MILGQGCTFIHSFIHVTPLARCSPKGHIILPLGSEGAREGHPLNRLNAPSSQVLANMYSEHGVVTGVVHSDIDECAVDNGGCWQICTNLPGNLTCSCHIGYTLTDDGKMCAGKHASLAIHRVQSCLLVPTCWERHSCQAKMLTCTLSPIE